MYAKKYFIVAENKKTKKTEGDFFMDTLAIKEILEVCKRLDSRGLVNAYEGNVSIKRDGYIYITPSRQNKAFISVSEQI